MRKVLRISLGVLLVIVGIIGLALPIMPQWPFLIPGLLILAEYFPPVRRFLLWAHAHLRRRHAGLADRLAKMYPEAFCPEPAAGAREGAATSAKMEDRA